MNDKLYIREARTVQTQVVEHVCLEMSSFTFPPPPTLTSTAHVLVHVYVYIYIYIYDGALGCIHCDTRCYYTVRTMQLKLSHDWDPSSTIIV